MSASFCSTCGTSNANQACGGCLIALYCDAACQKIDWKKGHKATCRALCADPERLAAAQSTAAHSWLAAAKTGDDSRRAVSLFKASAAKMCRGHAVAASNAAILLAERCIALVVSGQPTVRLDSTSTAYSEKAVHDRQLSALSARDDCPDGTLLEGSALVAARADAAEAMKLYHQAADAGWAEAIFNLGAVYETGILVPQDNERARGLYLRVALCGVVHVAQAAQHALKKLAIKIRCAFVKPPTTLHPDPPS
jgi:TPR repeat protein